MSPVLPLRLGWANPENAAGASLRLYGDDVPSPRWVNKPYGHTAERALAHAGIGHEGDRFLLVPVGDRHITDDQLADLAARIQTLIGEAE